MRRPLNLLLDIIIVPFNPRVGLCLSNSSEFDLGYIHPTLVALLFNKHQLILVRRMDF